MIEVRLCHDNPMKNDVATFSPVVLSDIGRAVVYCPIDSSTPPPVRGIGKE